MPHIKKRLVPLVTRNNQVLSDKRQTVSQEFAKLNDAELLEKFLSFGEHKLYLGSLIEESLNLCRTEVLRRMAPPKAARKKGKLQMTSK